MERITYQNEENGFSVIKCRAKGFQDLVTVVGNMTGRKENALAGFHPTSQRQNRQILECSAKRIVQKFGKDTLEVIETDPDSLIQVEGIGQKRVERIKKGWQEQKEIKNIMLFLQSHDVSTAHAARIYKTYGNNSIKIVEENPYRLADDIWGIGFKTADQIASKLGIEKDRFIRLRSGILYTLNKLSENGHCYAVRDQLIETAVKLLEVEAPELEITLDEMLRTSDVIKDGAAYVLHLRCRTRHGSKDHSSSPGISACGRLSEE